MDDTTHRELGVELFERCWELLDQDTRSHDDNQELLVAAFASRYHWSFAGGNEQFIIGDWMISRVAAVVGEWELALSYAQRAYDQSQRVDVPDCLSASVCEGLARAYAASGNLASCEEWVTMAERLVALIVNDEDRELIANQLASIPWQHSSQTTNDRLVNLRSAREGESLALTKLVVESKRYWGYDDEFMERCRSELLVDESDIAMGNVCVAVDDDDEAIGVYVVKELSEWEVELDSLFVAPSQMRAGVGTALLVHAINRARADAYVTVRLDSDPFASSFYERHGALLVGTATSVSTGRELPRYVFRLEG